MTPDISQLLRELNPVPSSSPPPIDQLWTRLETEPIRPKGTNASIQTATRAKYRAPWSSRVPIMATTGIAVALVGAAVLLLHASPHRRLRAAQSSPAALIKLLGVLRRPQTSEDLKAGRAASSSVRHLDGTAPGAQAPHRLGRMTVVDSLTRVAGRLPGGQRLVLAPVQINPPSSSTHTRPHFGLALLGEGASCCDTAADITSGDAYASYGNGTQNVLIVVVPDGTARVRVATPTPTPTPVTATVHNNVAVLRPSSGVENIQQYAMTWYSQNGRILQVFAAGRVG